jgi:hypothetical protein
MEPGAHRVTLYGKSELASGLSAVKARIFYRVEGIGDVPTIECCENGDWRIVLEFESSASFISMLNAAAHVLAEENVPPSLVEVSVRGRNYALSQLLRM